jgi:mannose-6-phosphate isomerase-like protein (cupin superfamily)
VDVLVAGRRTTVTVEDLLSRDPIAPGEPVRVREIGRDDATSHHVVWIRDREELHRHDHHELVVVLLRGEGAMRLGDDERPVGAGSLLYVPRGAPHAFRNTAGEPAAAWVIYAPPFDGKDRVPADAPRAAAPAEGGTR